jgi:iron complex outermembrane recepter protein
MNTRNLAALLALCALPSAFAQTVQRGQEVVVTATRFPETQDTLGPGVQVIDRKRIDESTAQTVVELLSQEAGIHVRDATGSPDWSIDLRGFGQTGDQNTLVLVDGLRFSEIDTTPAKWSAIPLMAVERIEIFRGDGAVLYGNGATGGVINIITRKTAPLAKEAEVLAQGGSWRTGNVQATVNVGGEQAGVAASGSALDTQNYRDNNQLKQYNLLIDLRTLEGPHTFYFKGWLDHQQLRNPGQLTLDQFAANPRQTFTPFDFTNRDGGAADLGAAFDLGFGELAANLGWREKRTDAQVFDFSSTIGISTEYLAFSPRLRVPWVAGGTAQSLVVGVDLEKADYDRNVSGSFFASQTTAQQKTAAVYLQNRSQLTQATALILGARTQRVNTRINDPSLAPVDQTLNVNAWEATLQQRLSPIWVAYIRASQGFRIAGVEETPFTSGPLLPQTSHEYELGVELRDGANRLRGTLYRINLNNEITFNPLVPPFGDNANLPPTRREGVELEANVRVAATVDAFATFTFTNAQFREGVFGGVDIAGKTVPLVPNWQASAGGTWHIDERTLLSVSFVYVDQQWFNNDVANALPVKIPDYATLDLKLTRQLSDWTLGLEVKNLLDRNYFTSGGVDSVGTVKVFPAPQRAWLASAEYRFR